MEINESAITLLDGELHSFFSHINNFVPNVQIEREKENNNSI
jgi:hypothetical protein